MQLFDQLEKTRAETLKYFALPEPDLQKTYRAGGWNVRYLLHHLADSETVLFYRIRRVISEANQVIWFYDQDAWAAKLDYSIVPMALGRNLYESSREGITFYARQHYQGSDAVTFVHSLTGLRTLKDEFEKVASHNEHHLGQIRKALGS
jgi:hypothetical protein